MRLTKILVIITIISTSYAKKRRGQPDGWNLGVGVISSKSQYRGMDDRVFPIPMISYKKGRFLFRGLRASYDLYKSKKNQLQATLSPNFFRDGYQSDDSPFLAGMNDRDGTLLLGLDYRYNFRPFYFSFAFDQDALGIHSGLTARTALGFRFPLQVLIKKLPFTMLGAEIGYNYYSRKYMNYYYGVRTSEVVAGRPFYEPTSSYNQYVAFTFRMSFLKKWSLFARYQEEFFSSKIKDSPLVDEETITVLISGLSYQY